MDTTKMQVAQARVFADVIYNILSFLGDNAEDLATASLVDQTWNYTTHLYGEQLWRGAEYAATGNRNKHAESTSKEAVSHDDTSQIDALRTHMNTIIPAAAAAPSAPSSFLSRLREPSVLTEQLFAPLYRLLEAWWSPSSSSASASISLAPSHDQYDESLATKSSKLRAIQSYRYESHSWMSKSESACISSPHTVVGSSSSSVPLPIMSLSFATLSRYPAVTFPSSSYGYGYGPLTRLPLSGTHLDSSLATAAMMDGSIALIAVPPISKPVLLGCILAPSVPSSSRAGPRPSAGSCNDAQWLLENDMIMAAYADGSVRFHSAVSSAFMGNEQSPSITKEIRGHSSAVYTVRALGNDVLTASHDKTCKLFDFETGAEKLVMQGSNIFYSVRFDGPNRAIACNKDGSVKLFDLRMESGSNCVMTLERTASGTNPAYSFDVSNDNVIVAEGRSDLNVTLWDLRALRPVASQHVSSASPSSLPVRLYSHDEPALPADEADSSIPLLPSPSSVCKTWKGPESGLPTPFSVSLNGCCASLTLTMPSMPTSMIMIFDVRMGAFNLKQTEMFPCAVQSAVIDSRFNHVLYSKSGSATVGVLHRK